MIRARLPQHAAVALGHSETQPSAGLGYGVPRAESYKGVPYTIDTMRSMVRDALTREQALPVRRLTEQVISGVYPKDYLSEVAAIYYWVLSNVRYVRDPAHVELVQSPLQVLQPSPADRLAGRRAAQEDCESISTAIAAMAMSVGNRAEFVTVSTDPAVGFHHVFAVVKPEQGQRLVCDPVPGPHTTQMLRSVARHQIWPVEPVRRLGQSGWGIAGEQDAGIEVAPGPSYEGAGPGILSGATVVR